MKPPDLSEFTFGDPPITFEELALAGRNRSMPLEGLRYDVTPTGMHYLVLHFDIPEGDAATWEVHIGGSVRRPLSLSMGDIRALPAVTQLVTMECAGNGRARLNPRPVSQPWFNEAVGTSEWTGTPLRGVLEEAAVDTDAVEIAFFGSDFGIQGDEPHFYGRALSVADAMRPEVLLTYEMNGRPLEPQHGYPLRLLVPGWYGMTSVKWLTRIEALTEPFDGFQQRGSYLFQRDEDDPGEPVRRMQPRALMIPPGTPDFPIRRRFVDAGEIVLRGRAWSGLAPIVRVEVGIDGTWTDAKLDEPVGEFAWRGWTYTWSATPGDHVLSCRATDEEGNTQPVDQPWNVQGMANNMVQQISVTVS